MGGGVLIDIHKDIPSFRIIVPELNVEHIFVRFSIGTDNFVLGGVYIPSSKLPVDPL